MEWFTDTDTARTLPELLYPGAVHNRRTVTVTLAPAY
jgi:hypothetical protein